MYLGVLKEANGFARRIIPMPFDIFFIDVVDLLIPTQIVINYYT
jgi:hypothetical protein